MNSLSIFIADQATADTRSRAAALSERGHRVEIAYSLVGVLINQKLAHAHDVVLVGHPSPSGDALVFTNTVRHDQPEVGIVLQLAPSHANDTAEAYRNGADLVVANNLPLGDLLCAIEALGRRVRRQTGEHPCFDARQATLTHKDLRVSLTANESLLLNAFVQSPSQQLGFDEIRKLLNRSTDAFSKAALELHIVRLRKKLHQAGIDGTPVKAIRGHGYQLCTPLRLV